uniref:Progestin and adipoQ receptor family member Vb n=1 Tax=Neogobius melanostomus TaxID=47308 RepID=A0A8C6WTJ6_9GOBI
MPLFLQVFQEDSIMSGYRHPRSSATDCVLSLFQMTNETLNIWTHFLPTWYFLWKLLSVVLLYSAWRDSYTWPLLIYLISICLYPLASTCAHTFSSMSARARHIGFFWDYGALSFYSLGSAVAYSHYAFPDRWIDSPFHRYFLPIAMGNSILCTGLACSSRLGLPFLHYDHDSTKRFPESPRPRFSNALRMLAFAYPYLFDSIPLFYRVFLCTGEGCTNSSTNVLHVYHIGLAFLTGFLFATHLPERLAAVRIHQLFHVCAILGSHTQMQALEEDMRMRRPWLLEKFPPVTFSSSVGPALLCLLISVSIICLFSLPLLWAPAGPGSGAPRTRRATPREASLENTERSSQAPKSSL